jgi:hypothetical protein
MRIWGLGVIAMTAAVAAAATSTTAQGAGAQAASITVQQHEGYMKAMSTANASLTKKLKSGELASAAGDAQQMATIFGDIERFWAQHKVADAVKWAQEGRQNASVLAGALTANDSAKVPEVQKTMMTSCNSCHMAYREGSPKEDGGYRLKAGVAK